MPSVEHYRVATRVQILVRGIVQGVGFRPYVFSLAHRSTLKGRVFNNTTGVLIDVEGHSEAIEGFINEITQNPPPLSLIESIERSPNLTPANYSDFLIIESDASGERLMPISADIATCEDCLRELLDAKDRRYRYPFINCTNCGPRFTIIEGIPYDREQTTMRDFEMCAECRAEYENPLDRRFHAEPTACPKCGPRLSLIDAKGREILFDHDSLEDAASLAGGFLSSGKILALKGLGGFHLACDSLNEEAVARLRRRKYREDKPFALMADCVEAIRNYCFVSEAEEALLTSRTRPIVLLKKRDSAELPEAVAPDVNTLGFMLPYTPLHYLLLENARRPLVMTSGNISDEPICYQDGEAKERLETIADYFLLNDRRIHMRTDDSVARVAGGREMILRRSRGYAPAPVSTSFKFAKEILACGAELKNTFCLARGHHAFLSHHIGDLENLETLRSFEQGITHFQRLFQLQPRIIAHDLHPEYLSTKYALSTDEQLIKIGVQHHHAHVASCMADNRIEGECIGVAMDGLGFGTDGRMWGGEFFVADFCEAERIAHLDYVPMPGGAKAIREPWRMAAVYLSRALGQDFLKLDIPFTRKLDVRRWTTLSKMALTGTNSPETSSMGRLFDALASLLSLKTTVNYEGQAAIALEAIADQTCAESYEFEVTSDGHIIKAETVIRRAVDDLLDGVSTEVVSAKFHQGVARLITTIACRARDERRLNRVVLSGGVFQNMFLLESTRRMLSQAGLEVLTHSRVPPNDGGISFGQAAIANARLAAGRI
jgi:hydrogenase maturation protein HypF